MLQSCIGLGERPFQEIIDHPVPLDMRILKAMRRSSLGLDVYMWLCRLSLAITRVPRLVRHRARAAVS
ncbi:replication protein RepA [Acidisarcina polymorpha]|uniref:replication protein RepA n=1 Tax=Acidisarcina polymorpha TaxID=2211140 RepID=UPI0039C8B734